MGLTTKTFVILALTFANAAMAIDIESDVREGAEDTTEVEPRWKSWQDRALAPSDIRYFKTDLYQNKTRQEKMDELWGIITEDTRMAPYYWKEQYQQFTGNAVNSFCQSSDEMKPRRLKLTHTQGVVAKVKWIPDGINSAQFSGIYNMETDNVILRLSETTNLTTASTGLMPSLAMKFLVDGQRSSNLFGMPSFTGSGSWDFFKNSFGSRVAPFTDEHSIEQETILKKLVEGSEQPFALAVSEIAKYDLEGNDLRANSSAPYELRWISSIGKPAGYEREIDAETNEYANWYDIVMRDVQIDDIIFEVEGRLGPEGDWVKIADVHMMTDFTTSRFGDERLHFQHIKVQNDRRSWPREWKRANDNVQFEQNESDEWDNGLDVPEERWPATDEAAKEFYIKNVSNENIGCPFGWLLDSIWNEHLAPEEILE